MKELNKIYCGDCVKLMKKMKSNSVDSIVTDPPYGWSFMGKKWDYNIPGVDVWEEALRVLKPGGYALIACGTRTQHRMAVNIEDAGFEIRDLIAWVYGSGFPKSLNVGKAIDKRKDWDKLKTLSNRIKEARVKLGLTKQQAFKKCGMNAKTFGGNSWFEDGRFPMKEDYELLKKGLNLDDFCDIAFEEAGRELLGKTNFGASSIYGSEIYNKRENGKEIKITKGNSPYEGWGTALKPAMELWTLCRKPLSEKTVAANVLNWGTGGINVDGCRVEYQKKDLEERTLRSGINSIGKEYDSANKKEFSLGKATVIAPNTQGRFPANFIHNGSDEVLEGFPNTKTHGGGASSTGFWQGGQDKRFIDKGDSGSAARFFYCAKASKAERNKGLEGMEAKYIERDNGFSDKISDTKIPRANNHPTVKPIKLMRYLCRLITPPKGIVLDNFAGSGSTGVASIIEGFQFIGMELSPESCVIGNKRIESEMKQLKLF